MGPEPEKMEIGPIRQDAKRPVERLVRARDHSDECVGHERGGKRQCCNRAGKYNGFASGRMIFVCPEDCSCHD